jgi:hypothetical protein
MIHDFCCDCAMISDELNIICDEQVADGNDSILTFQLRRYRRDNACVVRE